MSSLLLKKGQHVMIVDTHASFVQSYMMPLKQGQTWWTGQAERSGGHFLSILIFLWALWDLDDPSSYSRTRGSVSVPVGSSGVLLLCPGQAACPPSSRDVLAGHALPLPCPPWPPQQGLASGAQFNCFHRGWRCSQPTRQLSRAVLTEV